MNKVIVLMLFIGLSTSNNMYAMQPHNNLCSFADKNEGETPLHDAAKHKKKAAIETLLKHGANPENYDYNHNNQTIIMRIFPSITFSITGKPHIEGAILTTLEGFHFTKNQVSLVSNKNILPYESIYDQESYYPEKLESALRNGLINRYP